MTGERSQCSVARNNLPIERGYLRLGATDSRELSLCFRLSSKPNPKPKPKLKPTPSASPSLARPETRRRRSRPHLRPSIAGTSQTEQSSPISSRRTRPRCSRSRFTLADPLSGPYVEIDMRSGDIKGYDAIFLSPHKFIGGPGSPGILVMNKALYQLRFSPPSTCGGGVVGYVNGFDSEDTLYYDDIEERENAGTPPII